MKKYLTILILLIIITVLISISCESDKSKNTKTEIDSVNETGEPDFLTYVGDEFPKPIGYVNDYTDLIDKSYEDKILSKIKEVKEKTDAEIVFITVASIDGKSIEDYTLELYNTWEVSRYGIILLISIEGRGIRITTGYDMEKVITDDIAESIIDDVIMPKFKQGDFDEGIYKGIEKISGYILTYGAFTTES